MLGKCVWLMLSLILAGTLSACSSANTSALAVPVWDHQAGSGVQ